MSKGFCSSKSFQLGKRVHVAFRVAKVAGPPLVQPVPEATGSHQLGLTDGAWMVAGGAAVPAEPAAAVWDALRPGPHQGQHHPVPRCGLCSHHPLEPQQVHSSTSHHIYIHIHLGTLLSLTVLDVGFSPTVGKCCLLIVEFFPVKM